MAFLDNDVADNGLQELTDNVNEIHFCSQEPIDYVGATDTYTLANHTADFGIPEDLAEGTGRRVVNPAIDASGPATVTSDGTATHVAYVGTVAGKLWAVIALDPPITVSSTEDLTLEQQEIGFPLT